MGFSIFLWVITSFILIFSGIMKLVFQFFIPVLKNKSLYLIGILFLLIILSIYIPYSNFLWLYWNKYIHLVLENQPLNIHYLWKEVWYTIVFFKDIWCSILVASCVIAFNMKKYPITAQYRSNKNFSHSKILIMILSLFLFILLNYIGILKNLNLIFLNIAVYTAVFYARFGIYILLYSMKKYYIPYFIGGFFVALAPILAGEHFLLLIILYIGIGITDIWMDYYQRDSVAELFEFNLN